MSYTVFFITTFVKVQAVLIFIFSVNNKNY